ncbi:MAG: carboxymethylenebutenolidase [Actinomycetota bacterium]|jgi:carboxymethylenebutenolidase|nr:carboxymethylenebutenolidase [Actinomycetota bacterium]MDQ1520001.1 carboxymethylenebutenolidase [Actinomycetota bacterium]MDQ1540029.1 carboxymethylenebutenolidase [Actinomycetota bacterium]
MTHERLTLTAPDGPVPADEVIPEAGVRGALVVVQEGFGVNAHIIDVCGRFATAGYRTVAPQLFHRDGVNELPYEIDVAMAHMGNLTAAGVRSDVAAALDHLTGLGFAMPSIGVVGFCMGGSVALVAACDHPLGAAVTFYGGGLGTGRLGFPPLIEMAPDIKSPWLGFFGDLDQGIPVDDVERLRSAAATASVPTSVVRYADAGHAFHSDARPERYHEPSAKDAWEKTLAWFTRYLAPPQ